MFSPGTRSSILHPLTWVVTVALFAANFCGSIVAVETGIEDRPDDAQRLFTLRVLPLIKTRCFGCHGTDPNDLRGDYDMRSRAALLAGGESGEPSLVPGKPDESPLYLAICWEDLEMPPKENDRLTKKETEYFREWIAAGAPWPSGEMQNEILERERSVIENEDGTIVKTSGGLDDDWTYRRYQADDLWAYRPVVANNKANDGASIDTLVDQKLAQHDLTAAPPAEPHELIRRVMFDVIGLPPTPKEIDDFLAAWNDDADTAWAQLVDHLLASPHYGERQAQHWLDVARYADTSGGSNDFERSGVWRYRDYVVRSFNADKRFDQFAIEQIAGDEVVKLTDDAKQGLEPFLQNLHPTEAKVAAGFLRMGPWEATSMNPRAIIRQQFLDDVVNHVGEVFLAQPMRCAKCHDHKFDPIPTRDYYGMMAVFHDTQQAEVAADFHDDEVTPDGTDYRQRIEKLIEKTIVERTQLSRLYFDAGMKWMKENDVDTAKIVFTPMNRGHPFGNAYDSFPANQLPPKYIGLTPDQITMLAVLIDRKIYLTRTLERFEPVAFTVYTGFHNNYMSLDSRNPIATKEANFKPGPPAILINGSLESPADEVKPSGLSCVESLAEHKFDADSPSPRLQLARWIASKGNPLTSRVIANRIWQQHFAGKGIVATPNNLGYTGSRPSNLPLLDHLANWLVENDWSLRKLHRYILMSKTYRRSTRHPTPEALALKDSEGKLLAAYPVRRLHAEEMRDAMLTVTGELNPSLGGPPVFPDINLEAAMQPRYLQISVGPAYQPSPLPEDRHRRTLYAFRMRGLANPQLEVFNKPGADLSCERRMATTITPQVFSLFNGQQPHDRSLALARRLENESKDLSERIERAYRLVYGRSAEPAEVGQALEFIEAQTKLHRENPPERVDPPISYKRSMVFEITGVKTEWEEPLDVYAGPYVPDLKPWDVGPETRGLAAFCLVMFNSNEFLYLE